MIVIDVNTGKFIGKGGNLEETVTKNNLEAAEEIARQLRLRDMGGIIVIDFIDMTIEANRELVLRRLVECLGRDRTKHQVAEVTSLGLVQMTRKRVGQGLIEAFSTTCESCGGRGIHIHAEPVNKVSLEKDMDQRYSKTSKAGKDLDDQDNDDENENNSESEDVVEETATSEAAVEKPRRKGRRAVSTGVISTN
jgi:Ribonuclease G/E